MEEKKLHLGCGKAYLPGWLNVDVFSNIKADAYFDVTNLPYEAKSFDKIYVCHLTEHLHRHMIVATFNHWRELLKNGGILRISVPNFKAISDHYQKNGNVEILMGLLYGAQDSYLNRHTTTFDEKYLRRILSMAGFVDVKWWNWKETEHSQHDDFASAYLPHLDKENGQLMSLNLEATRP